MLKRHLRRALQDMRSNRMLSLVTISTFALSILIFSSAMLFFINLGDILDGWRQGVRVMAYLRPGVVTRRVRFRRGRTVPIRRGRLPQPRADAEVAVSEEFADAHGLEPGDRELLERTVIYFDFDKSELKPEARATLQQKADFMRAYPGVDVIIEGHCDERGTVEYNLALGDQRQVELADDDAGGTGGELGADEIRFDDTGRVDQGGSEELMEKEQLSNDKTMRSAWLRRVQNDPAEFLSARFAYQLYREQAEQGGVDETD